MTALQDFHIPIQSEKGTIAYEIRSCIKVSGRIRDNFNQLQAGQ
jgi:hypothetical protein